MKKRHKQEAKKSPRGKNEPPAMFSSTSLQMWPSTLSTKASQAQKMLKTKAQNMLKTKALSMPLKKASHAQSRPQSWRIHLFSALVGVGTCNVTGDKTNIPSQKFIHTGFMNMDCRIAECHHVSHGLDVVRDFDIWSKVIIRFQKINGTCQNPLLLLRFTGSQ